MKDLTQGVPVLGVTGVNGSGKTLVAASGAVARLRAGGRVVSTVPISCEAGDSEPLKSFGQLLDLEDCLVLLDEVSVVLSSRETNSLPQEVVVLLQTLRHRNVTVIWTAPAWMRADNLLREVTQAVVTTQPLGKARGGGPWGRPLLILAKLLDTTEGATDESPTRVLRRALYIPSRMDGFGAYDTLADVGILGGRAGSRYCSDCGGAIDRPKHSAEYHARLGLPWRGEPAPVSAPVTFVEQK